MKIKKILIIDDSSTSRMIIKRCIEIAGFCNVQFFEAEDGLNALSFLNNNSVDLIIVDINMPKLGGEDLIKKVKIHEKMKKIPILVITSNENEVIKKELENLGILGFIQKPVTPEILFNVLGGKNG